MEVFLDGRSPPPPPPSPPPPPPPSWLACTLTFPPPRAFAEFRTTVVYEGGRAGGCCRPLQLLSRLRTSIQTAMFQTEGFTARGRDQCCLLSCAHAD
eukprot:8429478-Pyramimonas_sp.AAC.1